VLCTVSVYCVLRNEVEGRAAFGSLCDWQSMRLGSYACSCLGGEVAAGSADFTISDLNYYSTTACVGQSQASLRQL
jgi:hypothetical protein